MLLAGVAIASYGPAVGAAERDDDERGQKLQAIELQAQGMAEMMPRPFFGFDGAYVIGNETFSARLGGQLMGSPAVRMGVGEVSNVLYSGMLDLCASKGVTHHRIRMCLGGEAGTWQHFWRGFSSPKRDFTAHVAGTLKGDYQFSINRRFGVLFGAGVSIPVVGPIFRGEDQYGHPTPLVFPGPVAGSLRIGASFRIG